LNKKPVPRTGRPNRKRIDNPDSDIVWGAKAIGARINRRPSDVYRMAAAGMLPVCRVGAVLVGKKSQLDHPETWPQPKKDDAA
jgi:hypothetical protein